MLHLHTTVVQVQAYLMLVNVHTHQSSTHSQMTAMKWKVSREEVLHFIRILWQALNMINVICISKELFKKKGIELLWGHLKIMRFCVVVEVITLLVFRRHLKSLRFLVRRVKIWDNRFSTVFKVITLKRYKKNLKTKRKPQKMSSNINCKKKRLRLIDTRT